MSYRFPIPVSFTQEEDAIANRRNDKFGDGFEYIYVFYKEKVPRGSKVSSTMLFEDYGAPMITFCEKLDTDADGNTRNGCFYEVVIYENGINVWKHYQENGKCRWYKAAAFDFPLEKNVKHKLQVEYLASGINITLDDRTCYIRLGELPSEMYFGVSACEQINRFYDFCIEDGNCVRNGV